MVIAGTRRMFRLREVIPLDEVGKRAAQTFDIPLPHNSVCINPVCTTRAIPFTYAAPHTALHNARVYAGAIQALDTSTQYHRPLPPTVSSTP